MNHRQKKLVVAALALASLGAALPLGLWLLYIHWRLGPGDAGWSNFTWPLHGFAKKWVESVHALGSPIDSQ